MTPLQVLQKRVMLVSKIEVFILNVVVECLLILENIMNRDFRVYPMPFHLEIHTTYD